MRLQTTNRDLMRIWKVFSPASLPKPPGQPSLHSFHPRLSFQLLKRSGRKREREAAQRPLLPALFVGEGVAESGSPGPDPYSQKISHHAHRVYVSLYKCTPRLTPVHTGLASHTLTNTHFVTYKSPPSTPPASHKQWVNASQCFLNHAGGDTQTLSWGLRTR